MSKYSVRHVNENDAPLLRFLAQNCPPLDLHAHYTYWVLCKYFSESCFVLVVDDKEIGFITSIETKNSVFVWQIGILKEYRSNKYSQLLFDEVVKYAKVIGKNLQASIAEDNKRSYAALNSYCKANGMNFKPADKLMIKDISDRLFCESEIVYDIFVS